MREVKVGNKAPAFSLKNQKGEKVSLKDYLGKNWVLLYFYPKAMTSGCTVQACALRDNKSALSKMKVKVLGVSIDSVDRLKKFEEKESLNFDLLSDPDHKVAEKYQSWGEKKLYGKTYMGLIRKSFLIDPEGKVRYIMEKVKTKTHYEDIVSILRELKK